MSRPRFPYTAGLVALVHCLARDAADAPAGTSPSAELLEEGVFRAARWGVQAELPDPDGRLRPLPELLAEALAVADRHARELRCVDQLAELPTLIEHGGGAQRQRDQYEIAGMDALLRWLTAQTSA